MIFKVALICAGSCMACAIWASCFLIAPRISARLRSRVWATSSTPHYGFTPHFCSGTLLVRLIHKAECLNEHLFDSLRHACNLMAAWRIDFNHNRPHSSLVGLTPQEYANRSKEDQNLNRANLN